MTDFNFYSLFIICPLVFLAGLIDAIAGGGGFLSLPAYMFAGFPVHMALGTNKLSSSMGTTLATARYALDGYINFKIAVACAVCSLIGSQFGTSFALSINEYAFKIIMLIIIPPTAFYVLKDKAFREDREPFSNFKTLILSMIIAFAIGAYDGFYGPGTGTFLLLLLTSIAHLKLTQANGITKVINLASNYAALTVFFLNGKVLIIPGLIAGAFNIAGNYIGSRSFEKGGAKIVRPVMIIVLGIFFIRVLLEVL